MKNRHKISRKQMIVKLIRGRYKEFGNVDIWFENKNKGWCKHNG